MISENSNSKTFLWAAFALCTFLVVVVANVGFFAVTTQSVMLDELAQTEELARQIDGVLIRFHSATVAAMQQESTGDPKFEEIVRKSCMETYESLDQVRDSMSAADNRKRAEILIESIRHFEKLHADHSQIDRLQLEILARLDAETVIIRELLEKRLESGVKLMQREMITHEEKEYLPKRLFDREKAERQIEDAFRFLFRLKDQFLLATDPEGKLKLRNAFEESKREIQIHLNRLKETTPTAESRQLIDELTHATEMYCQSFDEFQNVLRQQDKIREETGRITVEIETCFEEIRSGIQHRRNEVEHLSIRSVKTMQMLIVVSGLLAVVVCILAGFFAVVRSNRSDETSRNDPFSHGMPGESPNADMKQVADKLQDVVNLLRKQ